MFRLLEAGRQWLRRQGITRPTLSSRYTGTLTVRFENWSQQVDVQGVDQNLWWFVNQALRGLRGEHGPSIRIDAVKIVLFEPRADLLVVRLPG